MRHDTKIPEIWKLAKKNLLLQRDQKNFATEKFSSQRKVVIIFFQDVVPTKSQQIVQTMEFQAEGKNPEENLKL